MAENVFKNLGWVQMTTPLEDVHPLDLLVRDNGGIVKRLNTKLNQLFEQGKVVTYPSVKKNMRAPDELSGKFDIDLSASINVSLIGALTKLINASAEAHAGFANARALTFSFDKPMVDSVSFGSLDSYIGDAHLNDKSQSLIDYLKNDDLFIVTEILKCKSFSIEMNKTSERKAGLEYTQKEIAQGKGNIDIIDKTENKINYKGDIFLVFALQAVKLIYNKSFWSKKEDANYRIKNATLGMVVRSGEEAYPVELLQTDSGTID